MRASLALAVAVALAACVAPGLTAAPARDAAPGHLVLVGGGAKPPDALRRFVELAGGPRARIVVLPLASGDSRLAGAEYVEAFRALGVAHVDVVHVDDRRDATRAAYVAAARGATGFWFSGGDQLRVAGRLVGTPLLDAIRARHGAGAVVGGTSAGTACMSDVMLTGRGRARPGGQVFTRGLGLAPGLILDTHFVARRRHRRLRAAIVDHPTEVGVGVDEGTAVWIRPDRTLEVIGVGAALVYHAPPGATGAVALDAVVETTLAPGDGYDLARRARTR